MSLTQDEQRKLADKCGGTELNAYEATGSGNTKAYLFTLKELAAYTAAVEAKRDAEVSELARKLAEQQAINKKLLPKYDDIGSRDCDVTKAIDAFNNSSDELNTLLAKERERCANRCVVVRNHYINTNTYSMHEEVMLCAAASDCESEIRSLK